MQYDLASHLSTLGEHQTILSLFIFRSYNQLQKYLRPCTVFWHKWPVHDLVLVIPPPPLIKVASNTRPYSKLGGTTLNGREEGGQYYILQTCEQERFEARKVVFPWECLIIFATGCSKSIYWLAPPYARCNFRWKFSTAPPKS